MELQRDPSAENASLNSRTSKTFALLAAGVFALMSAAFFARGLQQLLPANSASQAKDLHTNWLEWRVILHRRSPYSGVEVPPSPYPPFTFLVNGFLYWPGWSLDRAYFGVLNFICLAGFALWGFDVGRKFGAVYGFALAMSLTAFSSIATGLGLGQNSILYIFLLLAVLVAWQGKRWLIAGLLLGIAMSKVNIALPFAIPFLVRREWKILLLAGAYMLAGTLAVGWWVHSNPPEMIRQWMAAAQHNNGAPYGPGSLLVLLGLSADVATRLCAVVFMAAALVMLVLLRTRSILDLFGIAAGFGRLWTYHRVYDNFMLVFLLVALAVMWLQTGSRRVGIAIVLLGFTVWFPIHSVDVTAMHLVHVLIWVGAIGVLAKADVLPPHPVELR